VAPREEGSDTARAVICVAGYSGTARTPCSRILRFHYTRGLRQVKHMDRSRREAALTIQLLAFCAGCPALLLLGLSYKTTLVFAESAAVLALAATLEVAGCRKAERADMAADESRRAR